MCDATRATNHIDTLVNTHGNGAHCYGNGEVSGADIVGTRAASWTC